LSWPATRWREPEERVRALVGLGALAAGGPIWTVRDPTRNDGAHVAGLGWMLPVVIAWLLGAYMQELRERASRAERSGRAGCRGSGVGAGADRP
jgi:hypothetical protein